MQAMHLETRLAQLDTAITMELWQEAYKVCVIRDVITSDLFTNLRMF